MGRCRNLLLQTLVAIAATLGLLAPTVAQEGGAGSALGQSGLVGEIEGAVPVADRAQWPTSFNEAPMLADKVAAGELPPVADRLPRDLMVLEAVQGVGRYGGTWRRGFTGPADGENGNRINASDQLFLWDPMGANPVPSLIKGLTIRDDQRVFTLHLREGLKWSDGHPFTADDFLFWYLDLYQNAAIDPDPLSELSVNGKPGRMVKVDDFTVAFEFDDPYPLFGNILAGNTQIGGGQSLRQSKSRTAGAYAPAHYLKQFLPKYSSEEQVNARARAEGFDNWVQMLHFKKDWQLNPELPTVGPWKTVTPINTPTWVLERNPYYWAVDTEGNQLPYIDRIVMTLVENLEVLNLRAVAGDYDMQARHIRLDKLPVLLENQERGNYAIHLDLGANGSDTLVAVNLTFDSDPEIAKWLGNVDFRRALSMGIDRDQLNETFWLGLGTPGSIVPADSSPYNPGPEWRTKWSTYHPQQANALLDEIGLDKKDAEGFRLRTDNGERLRFEIQVIDAFLAWPQQGEMIAAQWRDIGIDARVKLMERSLALTRARNNEHQMMLWGNDGSELMFLRPRTVLPVEPSEALEGPLYAQWYVSDGKEGRKPQDPNLLRAYELLELARLQTREDRIATAQEIWKILVELQDQIGVVGQSPAFMGVRLVNNELGNVPARVCIADQCRTPGGAHPETWYYKE